MARAADRSTYCARATNHYRMRAAGPANKADRAAAVRELTLIVGLSMVCLALSLLLGVHRPAHGAVESVWAGVFMLPFGAVLALLGIDNADHAYVAATSWALLLANLAWALACVAEALNVQRRHGGLGDWCSASFGLYALVGTAGTIYQAWRIRNPSLPAVWFSVALFFLGLCTIGFLDLVVSQYYAGAAAAFVPPDRGPLLNFLRSVEWLVLGLVALRVYSGKAPLPLAERRRELLSVFIRRLDRERGRGTSRPAVYIHRYPNGGDGGGAMGDVFEPSQEEIVQESRFGAKLTTARADNPMGSHALGGLAPAPAPGDAELEEPRRAEGEDELHAVATYLAAPN